MHMHPALTYTLLGLCAAFFAFAWWLDARPDTHRLARYKRFTLIMQLVAFASAVAVLRPGRGTHDDPGTFASTIGNGTPALIDLYSNW